MIIHGSGTKRQKQIVLNALQKCGADAVILNRVEVCNRAEVNDLRRAASGTGKEGDTILGFAVFPNPKRHIKGNRIVMAGKSPWLENTTIHELCHLLRGHQESDADDYVIEILGHFQEAA